MAADWNPEEVAKALDSELRVYEDRSFEDIARRKLTEGVVFAADALLHIAMHSENESNRMRASEYILNRVMGRPTDEPLGNANKDDALAQLAGTVTRSQSN